MRSVLTYDIGGTTISAAHVDDALNPDNRVERPIRASGTHEEICEDLERLRREVDAGNEIDGSKIDGSKIDGVAVAMPAPTDYHSGTCWMTHKLQALYGHSLAPLLGIADRPVAFINDAAAFGLAEATVGAGRDRRRCLALTLGTGIGSAFALDGEIVTEHLDVPADGALWDLPFPADERLSIEQAYQQVVRSVPSLRKAANAAHGARPSELFVRLGETIGDAIAPSVERFGAEVVILGGGVSRSAPLFAPALRQKLSQQLGASCPQVVPAALGDVAAHVGATIALQQRLQCFSPRQLIYLHGMASGPGAAKAVRFRDELARRGVTLEVPQLDGGDFYSMTISRQLEILDRLMLGRPAGSVVLIGSSLGGYTAAIQAARSNAVVALVLMAPAFDFARRWEQKLGAEATARWQRTGALSMMHYATDRQAITPRRSAGGSCRSVTPCPSRGALPPGLRQAQISWDLMSDGRTHPAYPEVRVPTLIFHGKADDSVLPEVSIRFAQRPNVELQLLDADHGLSDAIDTIIDEALRFLSAWWA